MFYKKLTMQNIKTALLFSVFALVLSACGGGDKVTDGIPQGNTPIGAQSGCGSLDPAPATADINSFCNEFWSQSNLQNNCAGCHSDGASTPQAPLFVRSDNINLAYADVLQPSSADPSRDIVDVDNPSNSYILTRMEDDHFCWATPSVCSDIVLQYIENWVGQSAGSARSIQLTAPNSQPPGGGREFPETAITPADPGDPGSTFEQLIYTPILREYCIECHDTGPGDPLFSVSNVETSYLLSQPRISLDNPPGSRFVVKMASQDHGCWAFDPAEFPDVTPTGDDCDDSVAAMVDAITKFAQAIPTNAVDPSEYLISDATSIPEGIVAAGGARFEPNQIALYEFKSGQGSIAYDTSGSGLALDLSLNGYDAQNPDQGALQWVRGYGIAIKGSGGRAQSSSTNEKINTLIQATGEYSIEAWVAPNNVTQENSRIINYSGGNDALNFGLGQTMYNYDSFVRNTTLGSTDIQALSTPDAEEVLQATLQHVVNTYDPVNGRRIYVNGELRAGGGPAEDTKSGGSIGNWDGGYSLVLGDERGAVNDDNLWRGVVKMVSIHNRALNINQVQQNFTAGVGEKFFLLFDISHIQDVPAQSYIMFEVSQFDNYSYLFINPTYVNLDPGITTLSTPIPIRSMRIGINSNEAPVGQAYMNLDTTITANNQLISNIGTTVGAEQGSDQDEFYLIFEALGSESRTYDEPTYAARTQNNLPDASEIGLKTFDELNVSMSAMTGVSTQEVKNRYALVKQQLPSDANINTFVSAHNIGITQLAMEYCDVLVNDAAGGNTGTLFGSYNFGQAANVAFADNAGKAAIIDPILAATNGLGMDTQMNTGNSFLEGGSSPAASSADTYTTKSELIFLIDNLCGGAGSCDTTSAQTQLITKAVCTAALASANTLIQ